MTKVRVGLIFDGLEIPATNGVAQRFFETSTRLAKIKGIDLVGICISRDGSPKLALKKLGFNLIMASPYHFYTYRGRKELAKKLDTYGIQILHSNSSHIATLLYARHIANLLGIHLITDIHDVDHVRDRSLGATEKHIKNAMLHQKLAINCSDHVIVMSSYDRSILLKMGVEKSKMSLIPNSVSAASKVDVRGKKTIVFIGNMYYAPNLHAAEFLISEIAPILANKRPDLSICIIGRGPKLKIGNQGNVKILGQVDNLETKLVDCFMAISPIFEGSGMKVKLMTLGSYGLPIAASPESSRGYLKPYPFIVCRTTKDYIEAILKLQQDEKYLARCSANTYRYVKQNYQWDEHIKILVDTYTSIITRKVNSSKTPIKRTYEVQATQSILLPDWLREDRPSIMNNKSKTLSVVGL